MTHPKNISILSYSYSLPADRIALHPLDERDASRLLICKDEEIKEDICKHIDEYLPAQSLLIFNNTKVINARLLFQKSTGGIIEVFLLEPLGPDYPTTLSATAKATWKCMIGGAGKWKEKNLKLKIRDIELTASLIDKLPDAYAVNFTWMPEEMSFAEVLENCGQIPLPPYIKRKAATEDNQRYQTVYAKDEGSVAAPTAGLHFTQQIFTRLAEKNIGKDFVTLHVGAGTFKPVKAATMNDHEMHAEWMEVSSTCIENILNQADNPVVAVGTTSLRTMESLYWMGVKTIFQPQLKQLGLNQWEVYEEPLANSGVTVEKSLQSLLSWLKDNKQDKLFAWSQILIAPGYTFKIANAMVTNFHQPQSTLLLLVAAAIGDEWKKVYDYALNHGFRFLSYGDGSLLFIKNKAGQSSRLH